jgi:hypothetical protein
MEMSYDSSRREFQVYFSIRIHWSPRMKTEQIKGCAWSCGICGGQSDTWGGFLRVLRFPLQSSFASPITPQSPSCIIRGMHNRSMWPQCWDLQGPRGLEQRDLRNLNLGDLKKGPNGGVSPTPHTKKNYPATFSCVLCREQTYSQEQNTTCLVTIITKLETAVIRIRGTSTQKFVSAFN